MAFFQKADLSKSKYIVAIIADINNNKSIKCKDGKSYKFKKTKDIISLEKVQTDFSKYEKILYPSGKYAQIFTDGKVSFGFTSIDKAPYSKMGGSRNSLGKKLADAGELATIVSLTKTINTPKDTGQDLFIENPDAFSAWLPTFQHTHKAVESIVGNLSSFSILHDATDKSDFTKTINLFCKKIKIAKDSWNPADIFIIKNSSKSKITKELLDIVNTYDVKDGLTEIFNNKIYEYYKQKMLYPISLKQLTNDKPKVEKTNEPGNIKVAAYDISIHSVNLNLSKDGKELGVFTFRNNNTNKLISLQVRGFPHGYGTSQTEITSDGTPTGGRLGKISTAIVDRIMNEYNDERIKGIAYFGKQPNVFGAFDNKRINEVYSWYKKAVKHNKVKDQNPLTKDDFVELIDLSKNDIDVAANVCQKIQGLKMLNFYIENEDNISNIMNKMINGAKKISTDNGFFIKIY